MEGYVTMKKILAVLTVIVMLGCMLSVTAFADGGYVPSPKHDDNTDTTPTSPQTGYDLGIGSVVMTIAVSGMAALSARNAQNGEQNRVPGYLSVRLGNSPGLTRSILLSP